MSSGLEAIANELRRLQHDCVDRIFVEDGTMQLIVPPAQDPDLSEQDKDGPGPNLKFTTESVATTKATPLPAPPKIELPEGDAVSQLAWLKDRVLACEVCKEHLIDDGKIVFGIGSPQADGVFCGEAPNADEAHAGEASAGKSGQLLTKIISAMGLSSENVFTTNIMKWRPEHNKPYGNRPPTLEEMRFCLPYLKAQIKIIQPRVIVALGNSTVSGLLGYDPTRKMSAVRGTWDQFENIPLMISFHPSYLVRNGTLKTKRMVWEDMLQVMEKCSLKISDQQRGFFLQKS